MAPAPSRETNSGWEGRRRDIGFLFSFAAWGKTVTSPGTGEFRYLTLEDNRMEVLGWDLDGDLY